MLQSRSVLCLANWLEDRSERSGAAGMKVGSCEVPKVLLDALEEGLVVPFVGAGVSKAVRMRLGGPAFPDWREFLMVAARRLHDDAQLEQAEQLQPHLNEATLNLLQAARLARQGLGEPSWNRLLKEQFDPLWDAIDPKSLALAKAVWNLGSNLVVTTNFDRVLTWACESRDLRRWSIEPPAGLVEIVRNRVDRPTVWHLHGHIDAMHEIILSPDGFDTLYPQKAKSTRVRHEAALATLRQLFAGRVVLFIGASLHDRNLNEQIRSVAETFRGTNGPHFMLLHRQDVDTAEANLSGTPVRLVPFVSFGDSLVWLVDALGAAARGSLDSHISECPEPNFPSAKPARHSRYSELATLSSNLDEAAPASLLATIPAKSP